MLTSVGFTAEEADADLICAVLASFDKGVHTSLAAVFHPATDYACKYRKPATKHEPEGDTLAERLHTRLVERLGTDDSTVLADAVEKVSDEIRGRTASPSMLTLMELASIVSVCCWTRRRNFLPVRVPEGSPGQLRSSAHASMTGKYK